MIITFCFTIFDIILISQRYYNLWNKQKKRLFYKKKFGTQFANL